MNPDSRERRARFVLIALLVGALGLFALGKVIGLVQDAHRIQALPPAERVQLLQHAIGELQTVCLEPVAASGNLRQYCIEEAQLVLQLPECTDSCRRAADLVLPHARR